MSVRILSVKIISPVEDMSTQIMEIHLIVLLWIKDLHSYFKNNVAGMTDYQKTIPQSIFKYLTLMPWNISVFVWKGSTVVQPTPGQSSRPSVRLSMKASDEALEVQ